jgi:hypothetical protein
VAGPVDRQDIGCHQQQRDRIQNLPDPFSKHTSI